MTNYLRKMAEKRKRRVRRLCKSGRLKLEYFADSFNYRLYDFN